MSAIVFDPSLYVWEKPVSVQTAATVARLAHVCGAPGLNFTASTVLRNASRCISKSLSSNSTAHQYLHQYLDEIEHSLQELVDRNVPDSSAALGFISGEAPWIKLLSRVPKNASDGLLESVGNALCTALLSNNQLSKQKGKRQLAIAMATLKCPELTAAQSRDLEALLIRSRLDLVEMLALRQATDDSRLLHFSAELLTHLRSDLNSLHQKKQQAADLRAFFSLEQVSQVVAELLEAIASGDKRALEALICFTVNLNRDLVQQVPILDETDTTGTVMWFDEKGGAFHVRLGQLLAELGSAVPGGVETTDVMRLRLPDLLAKPLQQLIAMSPQARQLGELLANEAPRATKLPMLFSESQFARLARTAPPLAIRMMPNRAVCSFSFLAFHLLTKPDLHYLTITQAAIDEVRSQFFENIGLGPTSGSTEPATTVGSKRTPSVEAVRSMFIELDRLLEESRIGRRYTIGGLVAHHNAYCRRVALFMQLVSGARGSHTFSFSAASWFSCSPFGYLDDKEAGTAGGRTPIPISPKTSLQLKYWESHLQSLYGRLSKVGGPATQATMARITEIFKHHDVPLHFLIDANGAFFPLHAKDVVSPATEPISRDFGRHFFASKLTAEGHTLQDTHTFLRHQGGGVNPQAAHGIEVHHDRLLRIALTIDATLGKLGISPLPGLSGGTK